MSQAVDDLVWVVNSPSFVVDPNMAMMEPIDAADVDAEKLAAFLEQHGVVHRVGRYFEQLVHFWLTDVLGAELLGAGIQIRDGKRTIGELDFVYRDGHGVVVHCEVSVKFFLHHPRSETSHFPGPNASDNFELKTDKLFDQQLQLSRLHYRSVQRREAIVKGMAFYRGTRPDVLPTRMHPDHATGSWIRANELFVLGDRQAVNAAVVPKPYWLAPQLDADLVPIGDAIDQLSAHFARENAHPLMLSLRDEATAAEVERLFVVSNAWPARERSG